MSGMSTQTVRSMLRFVAVVTILVGGIGVSTTIIGSFASRQLMERLSEGLRVQSSVGSAGLFGILSWLVVVAWGAALYQLSPGIAHHITSEPEPEPVEPKRVPGHGGSTLR
jgi:hypothetical protein